MQTDIAGPAATARNRTRGLVALTVVLIALRFLSAFLPLAHDEAYYWLWSLHPATGYFDHPPAIAFLIRLGTALFGKSVFGIRFAGLLLAVPTTVLVARAAYLVSGRTEDAARAAAFFNATLMVTAQTVMQSPDAPALVCVAAFIWALLELVRSNRPAWWLVAGVAAGLGLLSKYTMFMMGFGTLVWFAWSKEGRAWLRTPWPWAGGVLAGLIVLPNALWNEAHGWPTVLFQFGRFSNDRCAGSGCIVPGLETLHFFATQAAMLSPLLFVLAGLGLWRAVGATDPARRLIAALVLPALAVFVLQSLRAHVHDNWPSFLYPALAVVAADGFRHVRWPKPVAMAVLPLALLMLAAPYVQTAVALAGFRGRNVLSNYIAFGMPQVAARVAEEASRTGARAIVTATYPSTGWLRYYDRTGLPVFQIGEDFRYPDAATPTAGDLSGPLLFVDNRTDPTPDLMDVLHSRFSEVSTIETTVRPGTRDRFTLYRLDGFHGAPIGRIPFPP